MHPLPYSVPKATSDRSDSVRQHWRRFRSIQFLRRLPRPENEAESDRFRWELWTFRVSGVFLRRIGASSVVELGCCPVLRGFRRGSSIGLNIDRSRIRYIGGT
ncbi:hypothetical protein OPV22_022844 [Ensete ventricosum]|uniref:Uncharacterized protein n=1 Tax=Ensete ventricosum TaxID=4639 RepID=A0AAV8QRM7_ENSVE|nr:hypothetical protein OPV22_022844 [Ensete ventricosum]